ncbi:hypothetical protein R1sor_017975 [Riccia sorocarpa]|uniref:Uncharacterized protein n=1 Tax=Riccia sorocarpa TaxID=122646 RepID=A0ABD3I8F9_9MARC
MYQLLSAVIVLALIPSQMSWGIPKINHGVYAQTNVAPRRTHVVPAIYFFGDSTIDSGNNNQLPTIGRANFPPYGRDFDTRHASGRFSNGKMSSDWINDFLHLPLAPPYTSPEARMYPFQGANFASAGGGILNNTGSVLGQKISGWQQIELFLERRNELIAKLGTVATSRHLRDSILYIATGGNDYTHNWITNDTDAAILPHDEFNNLLLTTFKNQLQVLYNAGARKVAVLGIGPVGCAPHFLWFTNTSTGQCMETVNQYVSEFNDGLREMLISFNQQNQGAHFVYRDIWNVVYSMAKFPQNYGFTNGDTACCGTGNYGGGSRCLNPSMVCENPAAHVWWDEYHPSHRASNVIARQVWSGVDPSTTTGNSTSTTEYSFLTIRQLAALDLSDG